MNNIHARIKSALMKLHQKLERFFLSDEEVPLSQHLLLVVITCITIFFIIWANFASLDEVARGEGKVVPSSEVQRLQSLEGGIIDAFLVKEGDDVKLGQPLLRLRDIQASSDLGVTRKHFWALEAKVARLSALVNGEREIKFSDVVKQEVPESIKSETDTFLAALKNHENQLQVLESQRLQTEQEVSELRARIKDIRGALALAQEQKNIMSPLVERGSASKVELLQLQRDVKEKENELNSALASLPRAESKTGEVTARIAELKSAMSAEAQKELTTATAEMNSIKESLAALVDKKTRTEVKSPVDGTVQSFSVKTIGGVIQPGAVIVEIVPTDAPLVVEARIKPSDIAFLHPGQKAIVKVTAYDYSVYGGLNGELIDISADTIADEKGQTFYRVRIKTSQTYLLYNGQRLNIIPGMITNVDILTGKRTIMQYLLKPFIKTFQQAMRER